MSARTATRRRPTADTEPVDASIVSDGMTIDTPDGAVDLVAIEQARAGRRVRLTAAELAYLFAHLRPGDPLTEALDYRQTPRDLDAP
ncbi:MAG: hypothetical protein ACRDRL_09635 [Sciscionella sp.]